MRNARQSHADDNTVVWPLADLTTLPDATLLRLLMRCAAAMRERGMPVQVTSDVVTADDAAGAKRMAAALARGSKA